MKILSLILFFILTANLFAEAPAMQIRKQKYLQKIQLDSKKATQRKNFITSLKKGKRISSSNSSLVFLPFYKAVPENVLNLKTPQAAERMGVALNTEDRNFIPERIGKLSLRKRNSQAATTVASPDESSVVYDENDGRFGVVSGKILLTIKPPATPESIAAAYNLELLNRPLPSRPETAFFKAPADETLADLVQRLKNDPAIGENNIEVDVQKRLRNPQ